MSTVTHFSNFNLEHWLKVKAERIRTGLPVHPERGQEQPNHALVGQTVIDAETGRAWLVKKVKKDWMRGWFLTASIENAGSNGLLVVGSLGCQDPAVQKQLQFFEQNFQLQH